MLSYNEIIRFVNIVADSYRLDKVHITGGDPLMRPDIAELIGLLSAQGIEHIALTTNGQLLGEKAHSLKSAGLRRINISLDSLDTKTFRTLTRGGELNRTLAGIDAAVSCGISPVKLNMVVLKGINDHEKLLLAHYGLERNCQVRFLELMPIGVAASSFHSIFVSSKDTAQRLSETYTLTAMPGKPSGSSRNFHARDMDGKTGIIGFISPYTAPFCGGCRRLRLTSDGRLMGCLALNNAYDIRPLLRSESAGAQSELIRIIDTALKHKRNSLRFETNESMAVIGG